MRGHAIMGREVLKKFDRYFLLDRIAQGGMAEIYRARLAAIDSANRLIVIKRIQAGYGENKDFLKMFNSETRVMMGFNHPNIVQLYDFGEVETQPFIAMEFIDGKNLRQFVTKMTQKDQTFPVDLAVHIIEMAASGLHYAHNYKDKLTGEPMNIIHRDVSPQNVIISFDGNVKLIDFGIAKASTNADSTRVGIIKGKPSYLSPEQIKGRKIDRRSDIFALGIVLWETLTGRKLFAKESDNEFAVLKLIENADKFVKPPSKYNPTIPKELDQIVLRALSQEPERRFQTAEEMQRALRRFLNTISPELTSSDLAFSVKNTFKDYIIEDRRWLRKLNEKAERLLISQKYDQSVHFNEDSSKNRKGDKDDPTFVAGQDKLFNESTGSSNRVKLDEKSNAKIEVENKVATSAKTDLKARTRTGMRRGTQFTQHSISANRRYPKKSSNWLGKVLWLGSFGVAAIILVGDSATFVQWKEKAFVLLKMRQDQAKVQDDEKLQTEIASSEKDKTSQQKASSKIILNLELPDGPGRTQVTINGQALSSNNPRARVPFDVPLQIVVDRENYKRYVKELQLSSQQYGGLDQWSLDVNLEPKQKGFLTIYSTPSAKASVYRMDRSGRKIASDSPWTFQTPMETFELPAGRYRVELKNSVLGMSQSFSVEVKPGRKVKRNVRLKVN